MILQYSREHIVALSKDGVVATQIINYWDICNALKKGEKLIDITEKYRYSSVHIWRIKKEYCPDC